MSHVPLWAIVIRNKWQEFESELLTNVTQPPVCSLPMALQKVSALHSVSMHNNTVLSLSASISFSPPVPLTSHSSLVADRRCGSGLSLPHTIISVLFFLPVISLPQTQKPTCRIHTPSLSYLAFTASHTYICKRACAVHSRSLSARRWQRNWWIQRHLGVKYCMQLLFCFTSLTKCSV